MGKLSTKFIVIAVVSVSALILSDVSLTLSGNEAVQPTSAERATKIVLSHLGSSPRLERPPAVFDHDLHTKTLKQKKIGDCALCHRTEGKEQALTNPEVKLFAFPKTAVDMKDKTAVMKGYHNACGSCHRKMASEGAKTGPDIGQCGKCHVKGKSGVAFQWKWTPTMNYAQHAKHVEHLGKLPGAETLNVAARVEMIGDVPDANKNCALCHHAFDPAQKKLFYKKDTENSCSACHKGKDEQNARAFKSVAHGGCIGCHLKYSEKLGGSSPAGASEVKPVAKSGPFECNGCHGVRKPLTPEEIAKTPRLARGQKDMMDLALAAEQKAPAPATHTGAQPAPAVRMKMVPFNHKAHEPRAQFCSACHHHSLEKCANCHTPTGEGKKGGGVSYEKAFHGTSAKHSCVGCHGAAKSRATCAGCHQWMPNPLPESSCAVCHRGPSGGAAVQIPPLPLSQDKEKVPEVLKIKGLEREFKPAEFPHLKIVNKLTTISNASSLATWFHAGRDQALCSGCHHKTELRQAAVKAPNCAACHNRSFDPSNLGKPGLLAAYHRQCIGCHEAMKQKPLAKECVKCHAAKDGAAPVGLIPPLNDK
jgi:hypothetical protein